LCADVNQRVESDASLQPLLANYNRINVDIDNEASEMSNVRKLQSVGGTLPFIYLVRADGKLITATSDGSKIPLDAVLRDGLSNAGRILNATEVRRVETDLKKAQEAVDKQEIARAVTVLTPYSKIESYAQSLVKVHKLFTELNEQAQQDMAACKSAFDGSDRFAAALLICEAQKKYGGLPDAKKTLGEMANQLQKSDEGRACWGQSLALLKARDEARLGRKNQAIAAYESIVKRYADAPVARLAADELATLKAK
jgi:tetratricopeptide (TPR) repeat protein